MVAHDAAPWPGDAQAQPWTELAYAVFVSAQLSGRRFGTGRDKLNLELEPKPTFNRPEPIMCHTPLLHHSYLTHTITLPLPDPHWVSTKRLLGLYPAPPPPGLYTPQQAFTSLEKASTTPSLSHSRPLYQASTGADQASTRPRAVLGPDHATTRPLLRLSNIHTSMPFYSPPEQASM